jgi:hypothetical protein
MLLKGLWKSSFNKGRDYGNGFGDVIGFIDTDKFGGQFKHFISE